MAATLKGTKNTTSVSHCKCGGRGLVTDTRMRAGDSDHIWRRHRCQKCPKRWTTIEYRVPEQKGASYATEQHLRSTLVVEERAELAQRIVTAVREVLDFK